MIKVYISNMDFVDQSGDVTVVAYYIGGTPGLTVFASTVSVLNCLNAKEINEKVVQAVIDYAIAVDPSNIIDKNHIYLRPYKSA